MKRLGDCNATDVAKDTADIILHGKSLDYLNDGVVEGRRTFANTEKYLQMALSSNFGNMISMAGASVFLPFLPMTAPQILLNNLLYDSSQFAIPTDNVDDEMLRRPSHLNLRNLQKFMVTFGLLSSAFDFVTFAVLLEVFHASGSNFQTGWFIESLLTQILVIFIIRTHRPLTGSRPSKWLFVSAIAIILFTIVLVETKLGGLIGFTILQPTVLVAMFAMAVLYLLSANLLKHLMLRHQASTADR